MLILVNFVALGVIARHGERAKLKKEDRAVTSFYRILNLP
jgi:hypothetical protein